MIHECVHAVVIKQLYTVTIDKKSRFLFHMYQFLYSFSPQVIESVEQDISAHLHSLTSIEHFTLMNDECFLK